MAKFPQNRLKMNKIAKFGRQKSMNSCFSRNTCNTASSSTIWFKQAMHTLKDHSFYLTGVNSFIFSSLPIL